MSSSLQPLPRFIVMSRWLQLPLYLGLILAQCVYVFHFWVGFIAFVLLMLALDLGVFHRSAHVVSVCEALK